jgi:hypothetical protein
MPYKVKVNGYEIECETVEDVHALIGSPPPAEGGEGRPRAERGAARSPSVAPADHALLTTLVQAGASGVLSSTVGNMLSAQGKGIAGALTRWALRVGLPVNAVGQARIGTQRGWRLTDGAMATARVILTPPS